MITPKTTITCAAMILLSWAASAQSWLTNGLVAYYPFNGNANDESGFSNHGTVAGPILTTDRFGLASSAFRFDGDDFIEIPDSAAFKSQAFTISVWFNASQFPGDTSPTEGEFLISKAQNNFELHLGAPGNPGTGNTGIRFLPRFGFGANWDTPASSYQTGQWHHVVAVYDPPLNSVGVFIDGQAKTLLGPFSTPNTPDNSLNARLGMRQDGTLGLFGQLDDVRIYNRALSSNEVAQLYAIESAPKLNIKKAVYLDSTSLIVGKLYQVQIATDLNNWTNYGAAFTATNTAWRSSEYFDVENWNNLFFRLQAQ